MDLASISPVNPNNVVHWYQEGVPGYVLNHPVAVGPALAILGLVLGRRWLVVAGVAIGLYGGAQELTRNSF